MDSCSTPALTLSGPFKATHFFESVAAHLKSHVQQAPLLTRRSRGGLQPSPGVSRCSGHELVNTLLTYLTSSACSFRSTITRDNAVKLAQVLLDYHVFTPAKSESTKFEDSKTTSYVVPLSEINTLDESAVGTKAGRDSTEEVVKDVEEQEIRREVALAKLLTLIEIPVLDNLLEYHEPFRGRSSSRSQHHVSPPAQITSTMDVVVRGVFSLCRLSNLTIPSHLETTAGEDDKKVELCEWLVDALQSHPNVILPAAGIRQIYSEIQSSLLKRGREEQALTALQMAHLILPSENAIRLLSLLNLAQNMNRDHDLSTMPDLLDQVAPGVFGGDEMTVHQSRALAHFLSNHIGEMGQIPTAVRVEVQVRKRIRDAWPLLSLGFCERINKDEFARQQMQGSDEAVRNLAELVLHDLNKTDKEKKDFLKKLEKAHPDVYKSCSSSGKLDPFQARKKLTN